MAATIDLITYNGGTVVPRTDGIIQDASIGQNGVFYGCDVTASANILNVSGGYGIIKGRYFEIQSSTIPVTLATTDDLSGRLYIRLDISNTESPIQLLTVTGDSLPALEQDDDMNFVDGVWEMELATFSVTTTEVSNVVETYKTIVDNATQIDTLNSNLGKPISVADETKSVPTGGADSTVLQTVTLPPGKYIFVAMVAFAANTSGMRGISITTTSSPQLPYYVSVNASNGGSTSMQVTRFIDASSSVTLRVVARQTSGSALSTTAHSSIFQLK